MHEDEGREGAAGADPSLAAAFHNTREQGVDRFKKGEAPQLPSKYLAPGPQGLP